MKKISVRLFFPAWILVLALFLSPSEVSATPYASSVTNDGSGTIHFILNENADNVTVTRNVGGPTNLMALPKGPHSFSLGAATTYEIVVTKNGGAGYRTGVSNQISTDTVLARFNSPRGVGVNKNPASPQFGRVYVANSAAGTTTTDSRPLGKGIYMLNADFTDALGLGDAPSTADILFGASANSPYRISIGPNNNVYIADFSDVNGNLFVADGNMSAGSGINVLTASSGSAVVPVGSANNHGSLYAAVTTGSLAGNDLTVYTLDEDLQTDRDATTATEINSIWRYPVNGGPLPFTGFDPSYKIFTPQVATVAQNMDMERGPDGKLYLYQGRSANQTQPNLYVLDANGTLLADSRTLSLAISGVTNDLLAVTTVAHIAVTPDGKFLALLANNNRVYVIPLTNGIPSLSNPLISFASGGTTVSARDVAFDAANNLYTVSSGLQILRAFSPGGVTTTRTRSDGTFSVDVPSTEVSVAATIATADEQGPVNGRFTISRVGDTGGALTVNYTLTGIASNGTDYATLATNVTLAGGATSTNITVATANDSVAELSETVILTISDSANYNVGTRSATVTIVDNEPAELSIDSVQPKLLECFSESKATFRITRKGLLTLALTGNLSYSPSAGTDFNGPASVAIASGIASTNFNLTSLNDSLFEGNESVTISVASGAGYAVGTPSSAIATIIDDETVPGTTLFADSFDTDTSGNWSVNLAGFGVASSATFFYDYNADGIPPAPGTTGGTTRGLKFQVNTDFNDPLIQGLSASPTGENFTGDYRLKFDLWMNYNGPLDVGGPGGTQNASAGIGTTGDHAQFPSASPSADGGWFSMTGEGGIAAATGDYDAYIGPDRVAPESGSYAAGTQAGARDNFDPYYNAWGEVMAPASQVTAYPGPDVSMNQTGITPVGSFGFSWHCVAITKIGQTVNWSIDGVSIATITNDVTTPFATTGNIFVGYHDLFASVATNSAVQFALFDNVKVETVVLQPTITSIQIVGANVEIEFTAGPTDVPGNFTVQRSSVVTGTYNDVVPMAAITATGLGQFKAVTPVSGPMQFYRIKR